MASCARAAEISKPRYVASSGTCTDAAVTAKTRYVLALLKQYNDNAAPALSESQVERIWDRNGMCNGGPETASISRNAKTAFVTGLYFGAYMTAKVKYERSRLGECRYFVDEFNAVATMTRTRAKALGWDDWLALDASYTKEIGLLDRILTKRGYPPDPNLKSVQNVFGP